MNWKNIMQHEWNVDPTVYAWNVDPEHPTTVLRLLSHLHGAEQLLGCLGAEEVELFSSMIKKYYKMYFKMNREYDKPDDQDMNGPDWNFQCPPFVPGIGPVNKTPEGY